MIKMVKPYTNENGWEDSELIIDISTRTTRDCTNWIRNAFSERLKSLAFKLWFGIIFSVKQADILEIINLRMQ